ncbi:hypothetical protein ACLOJK_035537 [Asimina triloba]
MEANIELKGMASNTGGVSVETNQFGQVPSILLNTEKPKDPLQDFEKIMENQRDVRDEECEEVWCDKENEVASETLQLKGKEFSDVSKNLVDETENILVENRLLEDLAMVYSSDPEKEELTGSRGKEKAYDFKGADRSVAYKLKNISSDKTVRKSQRVHTRTQKLNL